MSNEIMALARIMCKDAGTKHCNIRCSSDGSCEVKFFAEQIYKAGYRKPKVGHWTGTDGDRCSECGHYLSDVMDAESDYASIFQHSMEAAVACPFCGTLMKEVQDD